MSLRQSLVFAFIGFFAGATFASASLDSFEGITGGERWVCDQNHFVSLVIEIVDANEGIAQVEFSGEGWSTRGNEEVPAALEIRENEIVLAMNDEHGGVVRIEINASVNEETWFEAHAQETSKNSTAYVGQCKKVK